ncbi:MAG: response regulator [Magnetococcales bacterium]|nr:response regulator [Magnetococcales bacterium]
MTQKSLLIVDDSALARLMLRKHCAACRPDWTILEACNGEEALEMIAGEPVTLALIDFHMPGMNGLDLAIRLLERQPGLSVHLVTANIQDRIQQRARELGLGFVNKPVSEAQIQALFQGR